MGEKGSACCAWGCLTLLALGLWSLAFGFELVGKACLFATFAIGFVSALRNQHFLFAMAPPLRRDTQPAAFWALTALMAILAVLSLAMLVSELRASSWWPA